jgi:hypothetical protein
VDLSEHFRQRACDPAGAAAEFEDAHCAGVFALADVVRVGEDVELHLLLAALAQLLVRPGLAAVGDVVAGVLEGAPVPLLAHLFRQAAVTPE